LFFLFGPVGFVNLWVDHAMPSLGALGTRSASANKLGNQGPIRAAVLLDRRQEAGIFGGFPSV
jgi:hypothetical protein